MNESFSDGEILNNPQWLGDVEDFIVNSDLRLQLRADSAGSSFIITPCSAIQKAEWSLDMEYDFNPSSGNYCRVYLAMDHTHIDSCRHMVYLDLGRNNDRIELIAETEGKKIMLIQSPDNLINADFNTISMTVKTENGVWDLAYDNGNGEATLETANWTPDFASSAMGLYCQYTKTRADKFFFDNINVSGEPFADTIILDQPERFDVVFNELMIDPKPEVGLPDCEYIELYNRSPTRLSLKGWTLAVNGNSTVLPDVPLEPFEYVLLVPVSQADLWSGVGVTVEKWPVLNNTAAQMVLRDARGNVMDAIRYDARLWKDKSFKTEGGWSLECVDVNNRSGIDLNWGWSMNLSGGTPGVVNSLKAENKDQDPPLLKYLEMLPDQVFRLHFNEVMNFFTKAITVYTFPHRDVRISQIDSVFLSFLDVKVREDMGTNVEYALTLEGVSDWHGNGYEADYTLRLALPDTIGRSDIIINEVLFNPRGDGVDFIELYNRSAKVIDQSQLYLADWDENRMITHLEPVTDRHRLLFPGDYLLLSEDSLRVQTDYKSLLLQHFLNVRNLPSMPDDEGEVILANRRGELIDFLEYNEKMHFDLIRDREGVALERLSPEASTMEKQNWHSAASSAGYATPSYLNSQSIGQAESEQSLFLEEELFTPDGDGTNDQLVMHYSNEWTDGWLNVRVFDSQGREVRYLVNNQSMGREGFCVWDGLDDRGQRLNPGIYVLWVQRFYPSGEVDKDKLVCVIGVRE